jgi:hypothetical protein
MKKTILFICLGLIMTTFNSCKKEGCTDIKAGNYSAKAKTNDGSCQYSEKLIFWQDINAAQSWAGVAVLLKIYVDGTYLGSFSASEYFNATPDCSSNGQLNKTIDFGYSTNKIVNITVLDETGYEWYNENITMNAGSCTTYQIL